MFATRAPAALAALLLVVAAVHSHAVVAEALHSDFGHRGAAGMKAVSHTQVSNVDPRPHNQLSQKMNREDAAPDASDVAALLPAGLFSGTARNGVEPGACRGGFAVFSRAAGDVCGELLKGVFLLHACLSSPTPRARSLRVPSVLR